MSIKKLVLLIFFGFILSSCVNSTTRQNEVQIAQSMKKEGDIFRTQGNYTAALTKLIEAEKITPNDPYLQNSLGLAYMGKNRNDLAVLSFKKALSTKPDYIEAINNLGAAYLRQGKSDMAIENFKTVLDSLVYPTPHYPLSNIGWAYLRQKKFHLAETYFTKALDEQPWFTAASHGLVQTYLQTGKLDQAMNYLYQCLERTPNTAILHADLAQAYEGKGQRHQAIRSWQMVLRLVPERSVLAKQAESRLSELE
jgi:type IV pilus biogenesis/stability protein PilW